MVTNRDQDFVLSGMEPDDQPKFSAPPLKNSTGFLYPPLKFPQKLSTPLN